MAERSGALAALPERKEGRKKERKKERKKGKKERKKERKKGRKKEIWCPFLLCGHAWKQTVVYAINR